MAARAESAHRTAKNGAAAARIRDEGVVHEEEYREDGLFMRATVEMSLLDEYKDWIIED